MLSVRWKLTETYGYFLKNTLQKGEETVPLRT
jgi:hypothetical protein